MKLRIMSHNVWGMYAPNVVKKVANRNDVMQKIYHKELPDVIGTQEFSADIRNNRLPEMIADEYAEVIEKYGVAVCLSDQPPTP